MKPQSKHVVMFILLLMFIALPRTLAQNDSVLPEPIYSLANIFVGGAHWSIDGRSFFFRASEHEAVNYEYVIERDELIRRELPSGIYDLTPDERIQFDAESDTARISPNQQYIFYDSTTIQCSETSPTGCWNVPAVGNLDSGDYMLVPFGFSGVSQLYWSDDESAFIAATFNFHAGGLLGANYVSGYVDPLVEAQPILLNTVQFGDRGLLDISADGRFVLLRAGGVGAAIGYQAYYGLILWDSQSSSAGHQQDSGIDSQFIETTGRVIGAAFINDDDAHILIVNEDGIVRHTLKTGEETVLNPVINSIWASWAIFSPDNDRVAVLSNPEGPNLFAITVRIFSLE